MIVLHLVTVSDEEYSSLYIQALNNLMQTPETTLTSYFQIAGAYITSP
jgi:hypothetical protein